MILAGIDLLMTLKKQSFYIKKIHILYATVKAHVVKHKKNNIVISGMMMCMMEDVKGNSGTC